MKIVTGIDFGTSMSMIQTMDHASAQPDALACRTVRFTQSAQAATPTLVRLIGHPNNRPPALRFAQVHWDMVCPLVWAWHWAQSASAKIGAPL